MDQPLVFVALTVLFIAFSVVISIVVLRFLTVLQQMKRADSMDRSELMHAIGEVQGQAYQAALEGLEKVHANVIADQIAMFNKTMDMVHGPIPAQDNVEYAVDQPSLDMREQHQPDDDSDRTWQFEDPTDADPFFGLATDVVEDHGPRTVSVRPGGSLVPGQ